MSYEFKKPITQEEKNNFIVKHNHINGLRIEDTEIFLFALEPNEIMGEKEIEIDVPDVELKEITKTVVELGDDGTPYEKEIVETVEQPVIDKETGKQTTHKETIVVPYPIVNPDYELECTEKLREQLNFENSEKAKQAVEQGFVEFKGAKIETNAQTVSDLTSAMLIMQTSGMESYEWLSMDDRKVELTTDDFELLGALIAGFKAHIWNEEYLNYKAQISDAETFEELQKIEIKY